MSEQIEPGSASHAAQQRQRASQLAQAVRGELQKALIGQNSVIDDVLTALIAGGHVLLEGVPGLGKTLLVRALARCFGGEFARIQFTPDLMPSDVTGHAVYDLHTEQFKLRKGPVFTNLLLADEINRAPAKTQAALLEAMQERQVTLEGRALPIAITTCSFSSRGHSSAQPLINSTWMVVVLGYSTAVPQTSPSPWQACASPMKRRPPAVRTGK